MTKTVRDIMRPTSACLSPDMTLDKVSDQLTALGLPGSPVMDSNGALVGYVSIYDCLKQLMESIYHRDATALAKDVMNPNPIDTSPNLTVIDVASLLNENKFNAMPVVENGQLIGVISRNDVMRALIKELENCTS